MVLAGLITAIPASPAHAGVTVCDATGGAQVTQDNGIVKVSGETTSCTGADGISHVRMTNSEVQGTDVECASAVPTGSVGGITVTIDGTKFRYTGTVTGGSVVLQSGGTVHAVASVSLTSSDGGPALEATVDFTSGENPGVDCLSDLESTSGDAVLTITA